MKKLVFILLIFFAVQSSYAQTKNGVVYSDHPTIDKTVALWDALLIGNKDAYQSFFADTAVVVYNGSRDWQSISDNIKGMKWWSENFTNLSVSADKPAYPDAIDYKEAGVWVQDWIRVKGVHEKTGIRLNLPIHNLYSFNKDGKITAFFLYFNNDVFDDIRKSQTTRENGVVYINHPYIVTVRKMVNVFCDENLDALGEFYADGAAFHSSSMGIDEKIDWKEQRELWTESLKTYDYTLEQYGYPDCIHYAQEDMWTVMSWWKLKFKNTETGETGSYAIMLTHIFNSDGKVMYDSSCQISKTVMK